MDLALDRRETDRGPSVLDCMFKGIEVIFTPIIKPWSPPVIDYTQQIYARSVAMAARSVRDSDIEDRNIWRRVEWRNRRDCFAATGKKLPVTIEASR